MEKKENKRSEQAKKEEQPGNMSSFNNRDAERRAEAEGAEKKQDKSAETKDGNTATEDERKKNQKD